MSMLSFSDLLRRKENSIDQANEFDDDRAFKADIEAALDLDVEADAPPLDDTLYAVDNDDDIENSDDFAAEIEPAQVGVPTPHAQALLAAFSVFENATNATREELATIGKAFTSIVTNYNLGREFTDSCRQEIIRASELEQANVRLTVENRRLLDRVEKQDNSRERLDDLLESSKRREARLIQDSDTLRLNVSDLRMELIETRNANVAAEHARSEMHMALAAKNADGERQAREIDVLRDKLSSVAAELDSSQKRHSEVRMKLEELQTVQAAEVSRYAELTGKVLAADKELLRLQKLCDVTEAQLKETGQALQNAEHEIWERDRRHQSELHSLKTETEQLGSRLQRFADNEPNQSRDMAAEDAIPLIPLSSRSNARHPRPLEDDITVNAAE